jgi:hypothetical protein
VWVLGVGGGVVGGSPTGCTHTNRQLLLVFGRDSWLAYSPMSLAPLNFNMWQPCVLAPTKCTVCPVPILQLTPPLARCGGTGCTSILHNVSINGLLASNSSYTADWCAASTSVTACPAAPIYVDIEYTRGREIVTRKGPGQAVRIGRMPLMLRCDK